MRKKSLLERKALERSDIVANSQMNRRRGLTDANSYQRELGCDPVDILRDVCRQHGHAAWLDLCCGSGKALIEAAAIAKEESLLLKIVGIDLVDMFDARCEQEGLQLIAASVDDYQPALPFDLITSVHGLHYLGDKLGVIAKAARWLTSGGRFVANLDAKNLRLEGRRTSNLIFKYLRTAGFQYSPRMKRLELQGPCELDLPLAYLGADDSAGPNYTGQAAVDSYYTSRKDAGRDPSR
ncbi:class I SAM-dependent methyltransferase [Blastopirellula retiformator]|uniref:Methyltransferase domain protein n=1 Tax=Blastopirellula retiformator TaxID=2527970 RepID=A0A5C5UUT6_9BACT|nr:class I SAM-dependent methyltransferase [Blastopirellula retiformator]TWT29310.1 Methyltransferase domain protein [Blastopirellula retiformator]